MKSDEQGYIYFRNRETRFVSPPYFLREALLTDSHSEEEFAPIAAAMKELPYFAPSPHFADKVMARVRVPGPAQVHPVAARPALPSYGTRSIERRTSSPIAQPDLRRSIPARIAATALVASVGLSMAMVTLVALFDIDLIVLVARVFGDNAVTFLSAMAAEASTYASGTVAGSISSAGTAAGAAVAGSFAAGLLAATAVLRAAASASRRAA